MAPVKVLEQQLCKQPP